MTYNVVDDVTKLRITLPFMEVIKIPQHKENIIKILDETNNIIEDIVSNPRQHHNISTIIPKGKVPPFLYYNRKS